MKANSNLLNVSLKRCGFLTVIHPPHTLEQPRQITALLNEVEIALWVVVAEVRAPLSAPITAHADLVCDRAGTAGPQRKHMKSEDLQLRQNMRQDHIPHKSSSPVFRC